MKRRGFSLIEALVALMLLLVALIPMAALPVAASRLYMASAAREQAALLAVQKLDELESKKFNDLSGGSQTIGGYKMVWIVGGSGGPTKGSKGQRYVERRKKQVRSYQAGERRCAQDVNLNSVKAFRSWKSSSPWSSCL